MRYIFYTLTVRICFLSLCYHSQCATQKVQESDSAYVRKSLVGLVTSAWPMIRVVMPHPKPVDALTDCPVMDSSVSQLQVSMSSSASNSKGWISSCVRICIPPSS